MRSKVKVNFDTLPMKPCGQDTDYIFALSRSNYTYQLLMMRVGTLLIVGHAVKDQRQLWHCGHDTVFSFIPITFKRHMPVIYDERRISIDFVSRGQR